MSAGHYYASSTWLCSVTVEHSAGKNSRACGAHELLPFYADFCVDALLPFYAKSWSLLPYPHPMRYGHLHMVQHLSTCYLLNSTTYK